MCCYCYWKSIYHSFVFVVNISCNTLPPFHILPYAGWSKEGREWTGGSVCVSWTVPDSSKWMEWLAAKTDSPPPTVCQAVRGKQPGRGVTPSSVRASVEVRCVWVGVLETPGSSVCQAWRCYWSNGMDISYSSKTQPSAAAGVCLLESILTVNVIPVWSLWHAMRKTSVDA